MPDARESRSLPRKSRRLAVAVGWCAASIVFLAGMAWNFAGVLQIERLPYVAVLIAPRNAVTLAGGVLLAIVVLPLIWPRARRVMLPVVLAVALCVATSGAIILSRGFSNGSTAAAAPGQLRVLSWNTNGGLVPPDAVARLAASTRADIVVLPQVPSGGAGVPHYADAFAAAGMTMHNFTTMWSSNGPTVVFVSAELGAYQAIESPGADPTRHASLVPLTAGLPTIVALHAAHPRVHTTEAWDSQLRWIENACSRRNVIAIGDFNATIDHFGSPGLGRCEDAASIVHAASVGSWPTRLPPWAGMPIDHVLVSPGWRVDSFQVVMSEDESGARHRPILAVLSPAR